MRVSLVAAVILGAAALVACSGSNPSYKPTPSDIPTPRLTSGPTVANRRTSIPGVDRVIEAIETGNPQNVRSLLNYTDVPCGYSGPVPPPSEVPIVPCPTGEQQGSPAPALVSLSCVGFSMESAEDTANYMMAYVAKAYPSVYAVYRADLSGLGAGFPKANYEVMLTYRGEEGTAGFGLLIGELGIVGYDSDCGYPPEHIAELNRLGTAILRPLP